MTATQAMTETTGPLNGDDQRAQSRHQRQSRDLAVEALVKETALDAATVGSLYDAAHEQLASHAKIKTYLSVIATRLVKVQLRGELSH